MPRRAVSLLVFTVLLLACLPLQALEYEVRMVSGNTFITRYEPVVAPFDESRVMFMTVNGNPISVARDQVKEVISLTEASGFGKRLDALTVLIGLAANDNPTPEEQAAMEAEALAAGQAPVSYTSPLVSEPDQTGGMPLFFLNQTTPPLGNSGFSGSAASVRRGAGETQFVEPQTRDQ